MIEPSPVARRNFVVLGRTALATGRFSLDDLPSSGGRVDVLLRCLRAGLLCSHGVRRDTSVFLVLQGGVEAPRVVRFDGSSARFLRPDERSLGALLRSVLTRPSVAPSTPHFGPVKPGIALAEGALEVALAALEGAALYALDGASTRDLRAVAGEASVRPVAFVLGDHLGFDDAAREALARHGARWVHLGPVSLHAEDAIAVAHNELDRG